MYKINYKAEDGKEFTKLFENFDDVVKESKRILLFRMVLISIELV